MDPPSPPDVLSRSDVLSWIADRTSIGSGGGGGSRESALLEAVAEGNVRRLKTVRWWWADDTITKMLEDVMSSSERLVYELLQLSGPGSTSIGLWGHFSHMKEHTGWLRQAANELRSCEMVNRMDEKDREKLTDMHIDGIGLMQVAANLGKIEVIRYLVEELGFDVNAGCLCGGATALGCAALFGEVDTYHVGCSFYLGHEEVARLLLSSGSRLDIAVAHGTPLHIAVSFGKTGVVKILLDHHADPNNTSGVWGTPILTALHSTKHGLDESDSLGCVKLLVKAGADVNYACPNTPLVVATTEGLTDCMKYLLQVHADPNIPDKQSGRTPIEIAASLRKRNHVEILFPFTSPVRAVTNWTVEGIITHGKSRCSMPKIKDEPCSKVNDRKVELKSLGGKAVKRKDYLGASRIYSEALELDYFDATLYSNRSLCYLRIGEVQKALLDAEMCVKLRPEWVKGHYREGAALMLLKEHKKAFEVFLNALKLDPANADIEKVLWEALEAMKKDDAAEEKTLKSVDYTLHLQMHICCPAGSEVNASFGVF
ncbi:Os03g0680400 [Oryza sativa Japonica Group]|uniref:Ankyrin n=2 Tax=Oryza sativa subsp. japonica TaxID=39947 RepID=A0A5S6RCA8_ORYSJ|nr:putative ankyrin [Oryza sativa Japonica Group]ABF98208.1 TPR Domain containing protein [Oryza sativa Japonica Group]BAF12816.1 Os03g0680400 [Oryza sativa Japonica Group]|eukprot:NP_001050902.1 Os03g0680400 [Oryza sativa Japonica Group]